MLTSLETAMFFVLFFVAQWTSYRRLLKILTPRKLPHKKQTSKQTLKRTKTKNFPLLFLKKTQNNKEQTNKNAKAIQSHIVAEL